MNKIIINIFILTLIFLLTPCNEALSQKAKIDSLEKVLQKSTDKKAKLNVLTQLVKESADVSVDKCLEYSNQAIKFAKSLDEPIKEAEIYLSIAEAYSNKEKYDKAIEFYEKAIIIYRKTNNNEGLAESLNATGVNYYLLGKFDDAVKNYKQVLEIAKKNKINKEEGNAFFNLGQVYKKKNDHSNAEKNYTQALKAFESIKDNNGLAKTNNSLGNIQSESGNYRKAMEYFEIALNFRKLTNDKRGCAIYYNNIGNMLLKLGKYEKAITEFQQALKIFENIGMQDGIATVSNSIGLVYENLTRGEQYSQNLQYHAKALEFHEKALKIWEALGNQYEIANLLSNIGNVNAKQVNEKMTVKYGADWENTITNKSIVAKEFAKVIDYYQRSLSKREKISDKKGVAISLSNLGKIHTTIGNLSQSLTYLEHALKLNEEMHINQEISMNLFGIGRIYYKQKNFNKALEYYNRSLNIAQKNGYAEVVKSIYPFLSDVYLGLGDCSKTQWAYKKFVEVQDSLTNENNMKQISEIQTQYETEKKEQQIQLLNKDAKLKDVEIKQKNLFLWFVAAGLVLVLVITVLLVKQNKERQKTNIELENKNNLITYQKKEITDSIHYASRIQAAVIPTEGYLRQFFPESFIYFKPRDIVSGDFYWIAEKNNKIAIAAADCTGHGVPGAFMSMLGTTMLSNIASDKEDFHSDDILNDLRSHIINSLHQTGKEGENKDGMDLALMVISADKKTLEFSGANNGLYLFRNGELLETKSDRMPIGIHERANVPFTKNVITLEKGDMLYTFSDGYHDQFGGINNKKFTSGNFKKFLLKIHTEPVEKQSVLLHNNITEWMQDNSQVDDMLVIGVKI